ncbi:MAG TPA: alpha/beta fold hydrolase [Acidobacteriaceae bacterium]
MTAKSRIFHKIAALFLVMLASVLASAQDGAQQFASLGTCQLESGQRIEDCRVGYRTFGHLNAARDNAVLVPTWLYGNSGELASLFGDGSDAKLRDGQLIDTTKWFGIAIDAFANGVSSSPSNSASQHGTAFPAITIGDSVRAQYRVLTETLRLSHIHAVVGLSMGGHQTFVWSALYPRFFDLAVPILGSPRSTVYDLHVKSIQVASIESDPEYNHGKYTKEPTLALANSIGALVVTTPAWRNQQTPRDQFPAFLAAFEKPASIDANDRVWQLKSIMKLDIIGNRALEEAARSTSNKFLVIVSGQDRLVNPQPALDWAAATNAPTYVSSGACAHLIMSCDAAAVSSRVRAFLNGEQIP